jgi:hypothetical protein
MAGEEIAYVGTLAGGGADGNTVCEGGGDSRVGTGTQQCKMNYVIHAMRGNRLPLLQYYRYQHRTACKLT